MNPVLKLLAIVSNALFSARRALANNEPKHVQTAIEAAEVAVAAGCVEARRRTAYDEPFSRN